MKKRDEYFDNLKVILIFFVVLGHFTNLNRDSQIIGALNNVIYSFHMPLFVFISGYFSKNITSLRKHEITHVLYPYIVFQVLHFIFAKLTGLGYENKHVFTPTYQNWYLLGLLAWRIIVPYFKFAKKIYVVIIVVLLSLAVGFDDQFDGFLGLYRIIFLLPIFTLGYYSKNLKDIVIKMMQYRVFFILSFVVIISGIFCISYFEQSFNQILFYAYTPVFGYDHNLYNFAIRTLGLISACVISMLFLFTIPTKIMFFTKYGKNTLNVFLLHMFIVWPINNILNADSNYFIFYAIVISCIITIFLSLEFINKISTPFINLTIFERKRSKK